MTIKEAAAYAKVSRVRINAAIADKELRYVEFGPATRRIRLMDLEKWIESKTNDTEAVRDCIERSGPYSNPID